MRIGRLGVWRRHQPGPAIVPELEALGYDTLWLGSSPSLAQARPYLEASEQITIATGILNIWQHEPADVAAQHAELTRAFPGSFLLGIGVGHPEATSDYTRPLSAMRAFFDGLDAAETPVPRDERIAAALGPKMLDLAAERSLGTHPYFTTPDHTRFARERVGPDAIVAVEVAVVVETDPEQARADARAYAATYLGLGNYTSNLLRFGFSEARHRRRRLRPPDRRGHPARFGGGDRRGGPGALRGGRRPRLPAAARPRPGAGRGLPGARRRAALSVRPLFASSRCSSSWAASSTALWRHSAARYRQAISPMRWMRRKSP